MSETEQAHEERIRQLERENAAASARLDGMEAQQRATWSELRRLSREGRDEFNKLRAELKDDTERLLTAINANKIAWSLMSGGHKAAAWIIGTLLGLAGLIAALATAIYRILSD